MLDSTRSVCVCTCKCEYRLLFVLALFSLFYLFLPPPASKREVVECKKEEMDQYARVELN